MKVKFGAIVTDGRGKIGGHVMSKNRAGAYMRTKVTPSNPNTSAQSFARSLFGSMSASWRSLLEDQRSAWNGAVGDWQSTDVFGDSKKPSGLNLFVALNSNLLGTGQGFLTVPPAKETINPISVTSATIDISTGSLTVILADSLADGDVLLVRATPPMSQGVSFVKSQLRVVGYDIVTTGQAVITSGYVDKYGTPVIGDNIVVTAQLVLATGQKSVPVSLKATVVA